MLNADVFNKIYVGEGADVNFGTNSAQTIGVKGTDTLLLKSIPGVTIYTGANYAEQYHFSDAGKLMFRNPSVVGINKLVQARMDIEVLGGTISENPFWRGCHFAGPMLTFNGAELYPRMSIYQETDRYDDPQEIRYVLHSGNGAGKQSIHLRTEGGGNVIMNQSGGNVGVGIAIPAAKLDVAGDVLFENFLIVRHIEGKGWNDQSTAGDLYLQFSNNGRNINFNNGKMLLNGASGNLGIGTVPSEHRLSVNGAVRAKEIVVDAGWSDYVFSPGYFLQPLSEVEQYVRENKRLPKIPSAEEVHKDGIGVGEIQSRLLAKIEELTLHAIENEKRVSALLKRIEQLEAKDGAGAPLSQR